LLQSPKLPGISHQRAIKAFQKSGFWVVREGKPISMTNGKRIIIIPRANPINAFTMAGIIKDAGLTIEEFKNWTLAR
jgi:predicted RNA binding protein YcfA (HicA-like mRNA interferase family)